MNGLLLASESQHKDIKFKPEKILNIEKENITTKGISFENLIDTILSEVPAKQKKSFFISKIVDHPENIEKNEKVRSLFSDQPLFTEHKIGQVSIETLIEIALQFQHTPQPQQPLDFPTDSKALKIALLDLTVQKDFKEAKNIRDLLNIAEKNGIKVKNFEFFKEEAALDTTSKKMVRAVNSTEIFKLINTKQKTTISDTPSTPYQNRTEFHEERVELLKKLLSTDSRRPADISDHENRPVSNARQENRRDSRIHPTIKNIKKQTSSEDPEPTAHTGKGDRAVPVSDKSRADVKPVHIHPKEIHPSQKVQRDLGKAASTDHNRSGRTAATDKTVSLLPDVSSSAKSVKTEPLSTNMNHTQNRGEPIRNTPDVKVQPHFTQQHNSVKTDLTPATPHLTPPEKTHTLLDKTVTVSLKTPSVTNRPVSPDVRSSASDTSSNEHKVQNRTATLSVTDKIAVSTPVDTLADSQQQSIPKQHDKSQPSDFAENIAMKSNNSRTESLLQQADAGQERNFRSNRENSGNETVSETTTVSHETKSNHIHQTKNETFETKRTFNTFAQEFKEKVENYKPPLMKIKMQLNPGNLGEVDVTLINRGNNLHVNFNANPGTIALFSQHQAEFRNALVNLGFTGLQMHFGDNREGQRGQSQKQQNHGKAQQQDEVHELDSFEMVVPRYV